MKLIPLTIAICFLSVALEGANAAGSTLKPITSANATTVTMLKSIPSNFEYPVALFSSDDSLMIFWQYEGPLQIWDTLKMQKVADLISYSVTTGNIPHERALFTPDNTRLVIANAVEYNKPDGSVNPQWGQPVIWDRRTGKTAIVPTKDPTFSIVISPDSQRLVTIFIAQEQQMGIYFTAQLWDISKPTPAPLQVLIKSRDYDHVIASAPPAVTFSPDGKLLAVAGVRNDLKATLFIFDASRGQLLYQLSPKGMTDTPSIKFLDNNNAIYSDGMTWALPSGDPLPITTAIPDKLKSLLPKGEEVFDHTKDNSLALTEVIIDQTDDSKNYYRVWDEASAKPLASLPKGVVYIGHGQPVFSTEGSLIVGLKDGQIHLDNTHTGRDLAVLGKDIRYLFTSHSLSRIVSLDNANKVVVWGVR